MGVGRGVCCAPIAARGFRKAPLKGELSPEATERLKGCRIAKHFGNSMPAKPLRHGRWPCHLPFQGRLWRSALSWLHPQGGMTTSRRWGDYGVRKRTTCHPERAKRVEGSADYGEPIAIQRLNRMSFRAAQRRGILPIAVCSRFISSAGNQGETTVIGQTLRLRSG